MGQSKWNNITFKQWHNKKHHILYSFLNIAQSDTKLRAGWLRNWGSIPSRVKRFISFYSIQTDSVAHPPSYSMGTGVSLPGGKATGVWSWPLTHLVPRLRMVELCFQFRFVFIAWCLIKPRDNFTLLIPEGHRSVEWVNGLAGWLVCTLVPRSGHDQFLPNAFQSISHPIIRFHIVSLLEAPLTL
jgi:hypothetical protein